MTADCSRNWGGNGLVDLLFAFFFFLALKKVNLNNFICKCADGIKFHCKHSVYEVECINEHFIKTSLSILPNLDY